MFLRKPVYIAFEDSWMNDKIYFSKKVAENNNPTSKILELTPKMLHDLYDQQTRSGKYDLD
jgi:hypothetical protein